ncbi:unnamed protein product [Microthlaspi erraticum]|uniref:Uncharacterized protein n=1 Tax=Microthlaspi erraticum TaxID=1685480 RepID=A0A6D2K0C8_9BRAS|nr:unnamed protein product [Microthlaspi erraticum]
MWKDHGRMSRQIFPGSCGYSSEAREPLPQNRRCSQAHSRTSEPNRIGSVEAVHEGRKTRRITWSAALAERSSSFCVIPDEREPSQAWAENVADVRDQVFPFPIPDSASAQVRSSKRVSNTRTRLHTTSYEVQNKLGQKYKLVECRESKACK